MFHEAFDFGEKLNNYLKLKYRCVIFVYIISYKESNNLFMFLYPKFSFGVK